MIDRIISEPMGGAQRDATATIASVGSEISLMLAELEGKKPADLIKARRKKFLDMGTKGLSA